MKVLLCLILFGFPSAGDVQVTRSITNEAVTGYDLFVNVTDGRNTVGPETLTVLISGKS